jgi:hypothetical protein
LGPAGTHDSVAPPFIASVGEFEDFYVSVAGVAKGLGYAFSCGLGVEAKRALRRAREAPGACDVAGVPPALSAPFSQADDPARFSGLGQLGSGSRESGSGGVVGSVGFGSGAGSIGSVMGFAHCRRV